MILGNHSKRHLQLFLSFFQLLFFLFVSFIFSYDSDFGIFVSSLNGHKSILFLHSFFFRNNIEVQVSGEMEWRGRSTDSSRAGKDEGEEVVAIINDDIFGALYRV